MIVGLAGAEDDPLGVGLADPPPHHVRHEVPPLLVRQPADESEQGRARLLRQAKLRLQCGLVRGPSRLPGCDVVLVFQMLVGRRIPNVIVHAVNDSLQHICPPLQHTLQTATHFRRLDLFGIFSADGADAVGENQAGLEQIEFAIKLHLVHVEIFPVQPRHQHVPVPEQSLVRQVVNRHQRGHVLIPVGMGIFDLQQGGNEPRLPIVAVHHVHRQLEHADRFEGGPAEEDKPLAVVLVVLPFVPV